MTANLQFGDYVFSHNPHKIELVCNQNLASYFLPFYGAITQNLGAQCRAVHCEGEVFSEDVQQAAQTAAQIGALHGRREMLYLPTGEHFPAVVSRFSCTAQGNGKVLAYRLDFLETSTNQEAK
ncbi:MAG: hypothetical protein PHU30_06925 [Oscillospiraceae bacterium]|nr:hypothetical protein [Oscillospiraceae bacterium]